MTEYEMLRLVIDFYRKDTKMKDLRFDDLYSPEYYMDVPGNDGRIAIKKFNDARDTMAMAHFSLSYIEDIPSDPAVFRPKWRLSRAASGRWGR